MRSLSSDEQVLKSDTRGRVRVPRERRQALLAEFGRSGVSAAAFARLVGVKYPTFMGWLAQQRRELGPAQEAARASGVVAIASRARPLRLFEAELEPARLDGGAGVVVELPAGARLLVAEAGQVALAAELLHALAQRGGRAC